MCLSALWKQWSNTCPKPDCHPFGVDPQDGGFFGDRQRKKNNIKVPKEQKTS